jgi:putative redox protein
MTASMTNEAGMPHQRLAIVSETGEGPFSSRIAIGDHRLTADEPVGAGGLNTGPDPYEYLLAGLGACTAMTLRLYATRKGWPLEHVEVRVRHVERVTGGALKDLFEREIRLSGALETDQRARLLDIADRCPVSRTLSAGALIQTCLSETALNGGAQA